MDLRASTLFVGRVLSACPLISLSLSLSFVCSLSKPPDRLYPMCLLGAHARWKGPRKRNETNTRPRCCSSTPRSSPRPSTIIGVRTRHCVEAPPHRTLRLLPPTPTPQAAVVPKSTMKVGGVVGVVRGAAGRRVESEVRFVVCGDEAGSSSATGVRSREKKKQLDV